MRFLSILAGVLVAGTGVSAQSVPYQNDLWGEAWRYGESVIPGRLRGEFSGFLAQNRFNAVILPFPRTLPEQAGAHGRLSYFYRGPTISRSINCPTVLLDLVEVTSVAHEGWGHSHPRVVFRERRHDPSEPPECRAGEEGLVVLSQGVFGIVLDGPGPSSDDALWLAMERGGRDVYVIVETQATRMLRTMERLNERYSSPPSLDPM
jgi:hypothetical protein